MNIGDINRKGTNYYIWLACKRCGKQRWVSRNSLKRPNYEGQCKKCSGNHAKPSKYKGHHKTSEGYILVQLSPDNFFYPMAEKTGYVKEHRLIMAQKIGRCLWEWEVVHHTNGKVNDNRLSNLTLETSGSHVAFHNSHGAYRGFPHQQREK